MQLFTVAQFIWYESSVARRTYVRYECEKKVANYFLKENKQIGSAQSSTSASETTELDRIRLLSVSLQQFARSVSKMLPNKSNLQGL